MGSTEGADKLLTLLPDDVEWYDLFLLQGAFQLLVTHRLGQDKVNFCTNWMHFGLSYVISVHENLWELHDAGTLGGHVILLMLVPL